MGLMIIFFTGSADKSEAEKSVEGDKRARGEKTAENIRYGEAISEHGFGGETTRNSGSADNEEGLKQTRREQGYGPGSGVGA
jgi:hypothetical protein